MNFKTKWRRLVVALVAVLFLCLIGFALLYDHAYRSTYAKANATFGEMGVSRLELVSVSPSLNHGFWFLWRMEFSKPHLYMPGDLAVWRLIPWGEVEFTK